MGLYDRPYIREDYQPRGGGSGGSFGGGLFHGMPRPAVAVKRMLLACIVVFIFQAFLDKPDRVYPGGPISGIFGVTVREWWQVWRYVTFQFLHGDFLHIALNMLGLYMLGTPLERQWGGKRFLLFYLTSGAFAGAAYVVMGLAMGPDSLPTDVPLIGASGGVFAIVLACAVLFPQFRLIFFLFPVPIRMAAVIIFGGMTLVVLSSLSSGQVSPQFWSDVAHLGGAVAGAFWIWVLPRMLGSSARMKVRVQQGAWQRKTQRDAEEEATIDEILKKIHDHGIGSLTAKEKKTLAKATERRRER